MKKGLVIISCLLFITACSSSQYSVEVSDGSSVIVSGSQINLTKQDYYEHLLSIYGADEVLTTIMNEIADKEELDQKDIDKLVKEQQDIYAKYADGDLNAYAVDAGYASAEEYTNTVILPAVKQRLLREKYIKENYEQMLTDQQVTRLKKIIVEKESDALAIINASTSLEAFDKQMTAYSENAKDDGIVTKNSTLDENLLNLLGTFSQIKEDGVYKDAIKLSDDTYAVVYIYDTAKEDKDEYIDTLSNIYAIQEEIEGQYLKKYHFDVYDSRLKDEIKNISELYFE